MILQALYFDICDLRLYHKLILIFLEIQTCAGAVVMTDVIFWCVIVPFMSTERLGLNMVSAFFMYTMPDDKGTRNQVISFESLKFFALQFFLPPIERGLYVFKYKVLKLCFGCSAGFKNFCLPAF